MRKSSGPKGPANRNGSQLRTPHKAPSPSTVEARNCEWGRGNLNICDWRYFVVCSHMPAKDIT